MRATSSCTIVTLVQMIALAYSEHVVMQSSHSVEGDENVAAAAAAASPGRRRLKLHHRKSSHRQKRHERQKGAEGEEPYDPFLGLAQERELQESMPSSTTATAMCEFCPGGMLDPDLVLPTEDGATCSTAEQYAATLTAADALCTPVKLAEAVCCPALPPAIPIATSTSTTTTSTTTTSTTTTTTTFTTTEEPTTTAAATTTPDTEAPPTPALDICSCSPLEYSFTLNLSGNCKTDDLQDSPGIRNSLCQLDGANNILPGDIEVTSIQFLEFDTSGELIVINQDDKYADTSLSDGDVVTFSSISADLDAGVAMEDQLDYLPGGLQVTVTGRVVDASTGAVSGVINRLTWSYTNACDVHPVVDGDSIGWITFDGNKPASNTFCPAATITTEAPVVTETPDVTTETPPAPEASSKSAKSAKHGKSKEVMTKTYKTPKNPMSKVQKSEESKSEGAIFPDAKSGKAKVDLDAKAEKHQQSKGVDNDKPAKKQGSEKGNTKQHQSKGDNMDKPAKKQSSNDITKKEQGSKKGNTKTEGASSGKSGKLSKGEEEEGENTSMDGKSGKTRALKLFAKRHHSFTASVGDDAEASDVHKMSL